MSCSYKIFSLPVIFFICVMSFAGYMAWEEIRCNNYIVEQSLKGNSSAVAILVKYEKPWKLNQSLVRAAIEGNEHAIAALRLAPSEKTLEN